MHSHYGFPKRVARFLTNLFPKIQNAVVYKCLGLEVSDFFFYCDILVSKLNSQTKFKEDYRI